MTQSYIPILLLSFIERRCDHSFQYIWVPFTQKYSVPSLVEIGQLVLEKIFVNVFSLCGYYFPLKKCMTLDLKNKIEFPLPKNTLCHICWYWSSGSGEDFQKLWFFLSIFAIISPVKKGKVLQLKESGPFNPRMFLAKFAWNLLGGSRN